MTFILPGSPILAYSIIDQRLTYTKTSKLWQFDKTSGEVAWKIPDLMLDVHDYFKRIDSNYINIEYIYTFGIKDWLLFINKRELK